VWVDNRVLCCCIVSHVCIGIAVLLSYVMSRGSGDWFKALTVCICCLCFNYHEGSFLSVSFIWVSWQEVSDGFEQRMKALRKSLLFRVIAGQTKSNETYRECVCVHLAVLETRRPEFVSAVLPQQRCQFNLLHMCNPQLFNKGSQLKPNKGYTTSSSSLPHSFR
jgi:hypothetical protein